MVGFLGQELEIKLLVSGPPFLTFCIYLPGERGGWHYRNEWAATTAFSVWDGKGAPMAGEWMDFS